MTTAYLARIQLNPLSRAVQRDLNDAVMLHRTLMNLVPDGLGASARQQSGLLFRLDETDRHSTLLVQAAIPLDLRALPAGYGSAEVKDLTPMFTALAPGLRVRFRIAANPVKRERPASDGTVSQDVEGSVGTRGRGPIRPLTGAEADEWWVRRAATAGLAIHSLLPTPLRALRSRVNGKQGMRHQLIRFDGIASVTDAPALTDAVLSGVGRGKPYGAGLLSLAPAGSL